TAKYHVSQIISKLGVQTREEAAAWQPEAVAVRWCQRALAWLSRRAWPLAGVAALTTLAGIALIVLLAWRATNDEKSEAVSTGGLHSVLPSGFTITGAIATTITWPADFPPNCYEFSDETGTRAFFFGAALGPNEYAAYASIQPFVGPGTYDAAALPAHGPGRL